MPVLLRSRVVGLAAALCLVGATLVVGAAPASATGYDPALELNPTGGTIAGGDGLHISYGSGQLQMARDGVGQFHAPGSVPSSTTVSTLLNGIYLRVADVLVGPRNSTAGGVLGGTEWDTITTSYDSTSPTQQINSTLTYAAYGGALYTLDVRLFYNRPTDEYLTEDLILNVTGNGLGAEDPVKLYRVIDTELDGSDTGAGYYETTYGPTVGVHSGTNVNHIAAFRRPSPGPDWTGWWSGQASCLFSNVCPGGLGYLNNGRDFPADSTSVNAVAGTNNAIGIMWDLAAVDDADRASSGNVAPDGNYIFTNQIITGIDPALPVPNAITFVQPSDKPLTDGHLDLSPFGDWDGEIQFTSATPSVCTVPVFSPGAIRAATAYVRVTFVSGGLCTIHANLPAHTGYLAAEEIVRTFRITVPAPPAPAPSPVALTSTGTGGALQTGTVALTTGSVVSLLNAGSPTSTVTVAGGVYTLGAGGVITFTPAAGFSGTATEVTYRVTNAAGRSGSATYTPTVLKPPPPTPPAQVSTGAGEQFVTITVRTGESITLLDAGGAPAGSVTVADQGTYTVAAGSGVITFTPEDGFTGAASGVRFRISDAYEQSGEAIYTPTVLVAVPTPAPTPTPTPIPPVEKPLPEIDRSKLVKIPADPAAVKGKEKKTKAFNSSFTGVDAYPITKLGSRQLVKGEAATLSGNGLFGFDSGKLTKRGRAEVKAVVKNLEGSETVHCEGYTDFAGDRSHEFDLSLRRAKAVCEALKKYGADAVTMTRGYGPKRPAVVGGTAKSRKENRRVVILITK